MRALGLRVVIFIATVWLIVTVAFLCVYRLPGDPARMILGHQASQQSIDEFRHTAGLDQSLLRQYGHFARRALASDFGESLLYRRPVAVLIHERSRLTLLLVASSSFVVLCVGFAMPILLRLLDTPKIGQLFHTLATVQGITPPYILGVISLAIVAGGLGWVNVIFDPQRLRDWILPSAVLAAYPASVVLRLFDSELGNVLHSPYVLRARAMGHGFRTVLLREALPNALTAALPALANAIAVFVTGTFFVEVIFDIPGLGRLTYEAIANKDIALLSALCLVFAVAISALSTLLELSRLMIDPRLREHHA
jgi:ABC-type dipeptide/oligopeptide/nickel transport system permease component